jgi:serine/threonine protein phosphatase 1
MVTNNAEKTEDGYGLRVPEPPSPGRRLAVGDVHGCFATLQALLKKSGYNTSDQLFMLGDLINRGKRSKEVLDFLIHLQQTGYQVFPIMGNHEEYLLSCLKAGGNIADCISKGKKINTSDSAQYIKFLTEMPRYVLSGRDFVLAHAGLDFSLEKPLDGTSAMLKIRDFVYYGEKIGFRKLLHGHTPIPWGKIARYSNSLPEVINIDNGCVLKGASGKGRLVMLSLTEKHIWAQKNID